MEDYNRLYFNMSQIDEEDSQMASLEGAEVSHSSPAATPRSHPVDNPDYGVCDALGTPREAVPYQLNLSDTPDQLGTLGSIAAASKENTPISAVETPKSVSIARLSISSLHNPMQTPKSVATTKLNVSSTANQIGTPKSAHTHTPRTIACPPKKARKPFIMLDNNLENTLLEDSMLDSISIDATQVHEVLPEAGQVPHTHASSAAQVGTASSIDQISVDEILSNDAPADSNHIDAIPCDFRQSATVLQTAPLSPAISFAEKSVETTPKPAVAEKKENDYEAKLKIMEDVHLEQQFLLLEQIAQADNKFAAKDAQIAETRRNLELADLNIQGLLAKIDSLEKKYLENLQENLLLKTSKEDLDQKIVELEERSAAETEKQFSLLEQIARAECQNDEKDGELSEMRQKLAIFTSSTNEFLVKIDDLEKQKMEIMQENNNLKAFKQNAEQKIVELEKLSTAQTDKLSVLLDQIVQSETKEREKEAEMARIRQQLLESNLNSEGLLAKIDSLDKQIAESKIKNIEKEAEMANVRQKLELAVTSTQESLAKIDSLEKQNIDLLQENALLKASKEMSDRKISELEVRSAAMVEKQLTLLDQVVQFEAREKEKVAEVAEIRQKLEVADFNAQGLLGKIAKLKERSKIESEEFDEIENNLRKENFQLKRDIVRYKCQLNLITVEEASKELGCDLTKII